MAVVGDVFVPVVGSAGERVLCEEDVRDGFADFGGGDGDGLAARW